MLPREYEFQVGLIHAHSTCVHSNGVSTFEFFHKKFIAAIVIRFCKCFPLFMLYNKC